jgi:hypothetical protein
MAQSRYYSATATPTTLVGSISPSTTAITVAASIGFPVSTPFIVALDYGTPSEEVCLVTAVAGTAWTITRAYDGTSGTSHNNGAPIRHTWSAIDGNDSRAHEGSTQGVHGIGALSSVVGTTDTQTLTNKTLTSPAISGSPTISGTISGLGTYLTPTFKADIDIDDSMIVAKRSATQTGALTEWRNELANTLASVDSSGVAHWTNGMQAGSTNQFKVDVNGNPSSTTFAPAYTESGVAATTSSTSYGNSSVTVSTTITAPPSGRVFVSAMCSQYVNTFNNSLRSGVLATGSSSGTLRAVNDSNTMNWIMFNTGDNNIGMGTQSYVITGAVAGETITLTWQHRVTGGAGQMDFRNISAIPLM